MIKGLKILVGEKISQASRGGFDRLSGKQAIGAVLGRADRPVEFCGKRKDISY